MPCLLAMVSVSNALMRHHVQLEEAQQAAAAAKALVAAEQERSTVLEKVQSVAVEVRR